MPSTLSEESFTVRLGEAAKKFNAKPDDLIEVLHQAQEAFGYLPEEVQAQVAQGLHVPLNRVYGVVTFYNFFTMLPKGRHMIRVCLGTSCYVRGGKRVLDTIKDLLKIEEGGTTEDRRFSLEIVRCVGACALSPVATVDNDLYSHVKATKVREILAKYE